ncbi:T9SS type A sorting domain-containing protein [Formosa sp. S-31]|uniref:T9SS type A sorting domain-containing protein n=1 Tax=Formosa sp. S-31 TaxID=2790949 RepID=UPI003EC07FDB
MKTPSTSSIKIPFLIMLLSVLPGITNLINAQIIYTDIEPDFTSISHDTSFAIDMDNDGVINFNFKSTPESYLFMDLKNYQSNAIKSEQLGWIGLVQVLEAGVSVKTTQSPFNWNSWTGVLFIGCYISYAQCTGNNWSNQTDKYIGVRFKIDDQWHYGWIRLDVSDNKNWTIKDYAYNATPEEDLLTGVTTFLNTDDLELLKQIKLVTTNKKITALNLTENMNVSLYSITGSHLLTATLNPSENIIPITAFASGIYIVKLENMNNGLSSVRKIILK